MMLDWLGLSHENQSMVHHGALLREAVYDVVAKGTHLTRDLGGTCGTKEAVTAVMNTMMANAQ